MIRAVELLSCACAVALGCADPAVSTTRQAFSWDGAAPLACSLLFQEDFESGSLAGFDVVRTAAPMVVTSGALSGQRSILTQLGSTNAVAVTFTPRRRLRVEALMDISAVRTTGTSPSLLALLSQSAGYEVAFAYFGNAGGTNPEVSVRGYRSASSNDFEHSGFLPVPARARLGIEWEAATGPSDGFVRFFVDGQLRWASPPLGDTRALADELSIGNTGGSGSGSALIDDVILEDCTAARTVDAASAAPADGAADAPTPAADAGLSPDADSPDATGVIDGATDRAQRTSSDLNVGCGCRVAGRPPPPAALVLLLLAVVRRSRG